ncbi:hypothetical protein C8R48DRAFT_675947 [Suillus tomentosus]|nr:hypothetical protein C8R48DRAFT_675947 [Suillus tomentosus]
MEEADWCFPLQKKPIIINSRITIAVNCNVTRRSNQYAHYAYEAESPTPIEVSLPHKRRVDPRRKVYPHREENFDLKSYYIIRRRRDQPYAHARIKPIVMAIGQICGKLGYTPFLQLDSDVVFPILFHRIMIVHMTASSLNVSETGSPCEPSRQSITCAWTSYIQTWPWGTETETWKKLTAMDAQELSKPWNDMLPLTFLGDAEHVKRPDSMGCELVSKCGVQRSKKRAIKWNIISHRDDPSRPRVRLDFVREEKISTRPSSEAEAEASTEETSIAINEDGEECPCLPRWAANKEVTKTRSDSPGSKDFPYVVRRRNIAFDTVPEKRPISIKAEKDVPVFQTAKLAIPSKLNSSPNDPKKGSSGRRRSMMIQTRIDPGKESYDRARDEASMYNYFMVMMAAATAFWVGLGGTGTEELQLFRSDDQTQLGRGQLIAKLHYSEVVQIVELVE